jgi:hypothetical protein
MTLTLLFSMTKDMRHLRSIINILMLAGLLWPACSMAAEYYRPEAFIDGQRCQVEIQYPSALGDGSWSDPVLWTYGSRKTEEGWKITAEPEPSVGSLERIQLLIDESRQIKKVWIYRETGDGIRERIVTPRKDEPVFTERSRAPFDMPVFPLEVSSQKTYRRTISLRAGLQAETMVTQTVRRVKDPAFSGLPGGTIKRDDIIEVTMTDENGIILAVQYWDRGICWPLCGFNRSMRYWLVDGNE